MTDSPLSYRLDQLGWLQFERMCSLLLEAEAGASDPSWLGHADKGRVALLGGPVTLPAAAIRLQGPVTVAVVWVADDRSPKQRRWELARKVSALISELGFWCEDRVLVLTNLDVGAVLAELALQLAGEGAREGGQPQPSQPQPSQPQPSQPQPSQPPASQPPASQPPATERTVLFLGARELCAGLDRNPAVRAAMPSVLGLRDLAPLIAEPVRARSSLDVERAQALANVFWPTRAYERARLVLAAHRFVVLTGPPEMGKTAIAQMLALAQMSAGWEAHECNSPEALWRVFAARRRQVFVADDAFGSTEYRPDAAERWARALGQLLAMLDQDHWLIWTSRPGPLKAGLRRVQRERGSERFPAPGEVLVDAGELDLAEKTLILFRHAKARGASPAARRVVRGAALSIVEHPHFTPERIRRFVNDRLEALAQLALKDRPGRVREAVERELALPTEAMRTSYRALAPEHRELLIALLDAPAGMIDERELAATVRRHHAGGLSRPPGELIDRLADHFVRITPLGIGWVHPSWRDLVIDELRNDASARQRFLDACSVHGAMLALSQEGGSLGELALPLLISDQDWDRLGARLCQIALSLEDQDLALLFLALRDVLASSALTYGVLSAAVEHSQRREARNLAEDLLTVTARRWDEQRRPLPVFVLENWYALRRLASAEISPPRIGSTWAELYPGSLRALGLDRSELDRVDEWLALAQTLDGYDPVTLQALGFYGRDQDLLEHLSTALELTCDADTRQLAESILARIQELAGGAAGRAARHALVTIQRDRAGEQQWWVPEDIPLPPSSDPIQTGPVEFTREDVARVLSDL